MYQTKQIHYKVIFKQDGQSETIEYKSLGVLKKGKDTHISFETEEGTIDLIYSDKKISLKHGPSILRFSFDEEVWNQYKLPYGNVPLKTKLIHFSASEERVKMKYELYDQGGIISTAYILISIIPYHFVEVL